MKVILLQDIPALGRKNEVKEVSGGYARNFLFRRKLAEPATDASLQSLAAKKAGQEQGRAQEENKYRIAAEKLKNMTVSFRVKMGEKGKAFGSVGASKIQEALASKGVQVDKDWMVLDEPIKTMGEKTVPVHFPHGIRGEIKINVESE